MKNRVAWGSVAVLAGVLLVAGTWVERVYYGIEKLHIYSDALVIRSAYQWPADPDEVASLQRSRRWPGTEYSCGSGGGRARTVYWQGGTIYVTIDHTFFYPWRRS